MGAAARPRRACHQERRSYGRALYTTPGHGGGVACARCRTTASVPEAPLPDLPEDRLLTGVDVTVHGGHPLRRVDDSSETLGTPSARAGQCKTSDQR